MKVFRSGIDQPFCMSAMASAKMDYFYDPYPLCFVALDDDSIFELEKETQFFLLELLWSLDRREPTIMSLTADSRIIFWL